MKALASAWQISRRDASPSLTFRRILAGRHRPVPGIGGENGISASGCDRMGLITAALKSSVMRPSTSRRQISRRSTSASCDFLERLTAPRAIRE